MKKSGRVLGIVLAALTAVTAFGGCGGNDYSVSELVKPVYEDNFEIMTFGDHALAPTELALTTYKEAGFNTYIFYPGMGDVRAAAAMCEQVGLDMLIFGGSPLRWGIDTNIYPDAFGLFPNYFKQFDDKGIDFNTLPAVKGFYFIDEPGADLYDEISEHYVEWFNTKYPDMIWHVNLFPSYATPAQLGIAPEEGKVVFEEYVDRYITEVAAGVTGNKKDIGVDHYPLKKRGADNFISETYLYDLMVVGSAAKKGGVYFSSCIQSAGWGDYRFPDKAADIRLQVYTNLAFGAKRLEFYPYDTSNMEMQGMYMYGEKTDAYYAVQEVIKEINMFDHVIVAFDWEGVKTVQGQTHNEIIGFEYIADTELESLNGIKNVTASYDAVIGQHKDNSGNNGFTVVNYTEPTEELFNEVTIEFEEAKGVLMYRGGIEMVLKTEKNKITVPLEAGEGVFIIPLNELRG